MERLVQSVMDLSDEMFTQSWFASVFVDDVKMADLIKYSHEYRAKLRVDLMNKVPNDKTIEEASYEELAQAFADVHKYMDRCQSSYFTLLTVICYAKQEPHSLYLILV